MMENTPFCQLPVKGAAIHNALFVGRKKINIQYKVTNATTLIAKNKRARCTYHRIDSLLFEKCAKYIQRANHTNGKPQHPIRKYHLHAFYSF